MSELQVLCYEPVQSNQVLKKVVWPWLKSQTMAGNRITLECRLTEDVKTDRQRAFYHGIILQQIAQQATVNGQKFPLAVWKEHFRNEYLGFRTVTYTNPMTGKKSRRRVRLRLRTSPAGPFTTRMLPEVTSTRSGKSGFLLL